MSKNKLANDNRKKRQNELREHQMFLEENLMLLIQVMQHWGALRMDQEGILHPIFEPSRNMPCAWLDSDAICVNDECNWSKKQCIFSAKFDQCKFYMAMIDPPKEKKDPIPEIPSE